MKSWPAAVALSALLAPAAAGAQPPAAAPAFAWRTTFKTGALVARAPDAPWLFPARHTATSFSRLRFEPTWTPGAHVSFTAAYEHRWRFFSAPSASVGTGVLPPESAAPYRVRPLTWNLSRGDRQSWDHEVDRATARVAWPAVELTAGRQAVGWGRGVLFSAIDVFAPFTPLEADREWRRGVDAIRADVRLGPRSSIEAIAAFDRRIADSAVGVRVRGYTDALDMEVAAGRRAGDLFAGASTSFPVGGAELHGEAAVFRTPAVAGSAWFGERRTIVKAVGGASYRFPLGAGLLIEAEYHYSGFGAESADDIIPLAADTTFARRYLRGDTQVLTRHTMAAIGSYEWSPLVSTGVHWLQNLLDGSGLVAPTCTLTPSDRWSLVASAYGPYGRPPGASRLRSEYGATPLSVFVEVRIYR